MFKDVEQIGDDYLITVETEDGDLVKFKLSDFADLLMNTRKPEDAERVLRQIIKAIPGDDRKSTAKALKQFSLDLFDQLIDEELN